MQPWAKYITEPIHDYSDFEAWERWMNEELENGDLELQDAYEELGTCARISLWSLMRDLADGSPDVPVVQEVSHAAR